MTSCDGRIGELRRKNRCALADGRQRAPRARRAIIAPRTGCRRVHAGSSDDGFCRKAGRGHRPVAWACAVSGTLRARACHLARGQVDERTGIAQVLRAHPVGQVDDPVDSRVVLDGELAELGIDAELIAELLVKLLDLLASLPRQRLGLLVFLVGERRAEVLGRLDVDDPAGPQVDGCKDGDVIEIAVRRDQGQSPRGLPGWLARAFPAGLVSSGIESGVRSWPWLLGFGGDLRLLRRQLDPHDVLAAVGLGWRPPRSSCGARTIASRATSTACFGLLGGQARAGLGVPWRRPRVPTPMHPAAERSAPGPCVLRSCAAS